MGKYKGLFFGSLMKGLLSGELQRGKPTQEHFLAHNPVHFLRSNADLLYRPGSGIEFPGPKSHDIVLQGLNHPQDQRNIIGQTNNG